MFTDSWDLPDLVLYIPSRYIKVDKEQLEKTQLSECLPTIRREMNSILLAVTPNHATRALSQITDQSPEFQLKLMFQPGALLRFLGDGPLDIDHVNKLNDEAGQRHLARKLKSRVATNSTKRKTNIANRKKPRNPTVKSKLTEDTRILAATEEGAMRIFNPGINLDQLTGRQVAVAEK